MGWSLMDEKDGKWQRGGRENRGGPTRSLSCILRYIAGYTLSSGSNVPSVSC